MEYTGLGEWLTVGEPSSTNSKCCSEFRVHIWQIWYSLVITSKALCSKAPQSSTLSLKIYDTQIMGDILLPRVLYHPYLWGFWLHFSMMLGDGIDFYRLDNISTYRISCPSVGNWRPAVLSYHNPLHLVKAWVLLDHVKIRRPILFSYTYNGIMI